ncbi:GNAT family N-acetyltransferase [Longispora sp. NPDC051575]|uniref:GNAT family N-acetyltransferase n=1 Tax=Longispora sp. NPDC051575 TaxID=3154943 RepID=UPI003428615A
MTELLQLEAYFDAVPRTAARTETYGPLTLFVTIDGGWPYYARPGLGLDASITAADVTKVRDRQRELGLPETFEWVAELSPSMREAAEEAGLRVEAHPILVLDQLSADPVDDRVRRVTADDPDLGRVRGVQNVGFGTPGTAVGAAGATERDTAAVDGEPLDALRARIRAHTTVVYAAFDPEGPVAAGIHQPVGEVTEIVGVATLPSARRRGLGAAVTRALAADALSSGVRTVFLSAGDQDVARLYEHVGFRQVGTAMTGEPA